MRGCRQRMQVKLGDCECQWTKCSSSFRYRLGARPKPHPHLVSIMKTKTNEWRKSSFRSHYIKVLMCGSPLMFFIAGLAAARGRKPLDAPPCVIFLAAFAWVGGRGGVCDAPPLCYFSQCLLQQEEDGGVFMNKVFWNECPAADVAGHANLSPYSGCSSFIKNPSLQGEHQLP
jgi:hypothetical protein